MNQVFAAIRKGYIKTIVFLSNLSFALIFFMAIWMVVDIIGRSVFNHPIAGTPELVKSLLPAIVFLTFAYTLRQRRHVKVDIIIRYLPKALNKFFVFMRYLLGLAIFSIITIVSWGPAWSGWLTREYEGVQLEVPVYPIRFIIFFGAGIFAIQYFVDMISSLFNVSSEEKGAN